MEKANKITAYNIVSTIVLQGISAITAPVISRMLGTDNYGTAVLFLTWVNIVSTIFGLQTKSSLALGRKEYSEKEQNNYQANILVLSIFSYVLLSLIAIIFIIPISKLIKLESTLIPFILIQGFGAYCISFYNYKNTYEFNAKKNFYLSVSLSVSTTLLSIILVYLFPKETNYWGRVLGVTIPNAIIGGLVVFLVMYRKFQGIKTPYWKFCLGICLPMMVHDLSGILLNQSDRLMLQEMCDRSAVGIYSLALGFASVLSLIWSALNNSWIPFFYEYLKNNEYSFLKKRASYYMEVFTVLTVGFIFLSNEVFHIYAGSNFWDGARLIPLFGFGYYMIFLYSFVVNFEIYCQKTMYIAVITLIAGCMNLLLNYYMIPIWGIYGAAVATTISHVMQFLLHFIGTKILIKDEQFPFKFSFFLCGTIITLAVCVIFYVGEKLWVLRWGTAFIIGLFEVYRIYKRKAIF